MTLQQLLQDLADRYWAGSPEGWNATSLGREINDRKLSRTLLREGQEKGWLIRYRGGVYAPSRAGLELARNPYLDSAAAVPVPQDRLQWLAEGELSLEQEHLSGSIRIWRSAQREVLFEFLPKSGDAFAAFEHTVVEGRFANWEFSGERLKDKMPIRAGKLLVTWYGRSEVGEALSGIATWARAGVAGESLATRFQFGLPNTDFLPKRSRPEDTATRPAAAEATVPGAAVRVDLLPGREYWIDQAREYDIPVETAVLSLQYSEAVTAAVASERANKVCMLLSLARLNLIAWDSRREESMRQGEPEAYYVRALGRPYRSNAGVRRLIGDDDSGGGEALSELLACLPALEEAGAVLGRAIVSLVRSVQQSFIEEQLWLCVQAAALLDLVEDLPDLYRLFRRVEAGASLGGSATQEAILVVWRAQDAIADRLLEILGYKNVRGTLKRLGDA